MCIFIYLFNYPLKLKTCLLLLFSFIQNCAIEMSLVFSRSLLLREQGWRSGKSVRLSPLWPGFDCGPVINVLSKYYIVLFIYLFIYSPRRFPILIVSDFVLSIDADLSSNPQPPPLLSFISRKLSVHFYLLSVSYANVFRSIVTSISHGKPFE